jgi:hypothetical protein
VEELFVILLMRVANSAETKKIKQSRQHFELGSDVGNEARSWPHTSNIIVAEQVWPSSQNSFLAKSSTSSTI